MPLEYSGEEQAVVAVGLARPRPGVFVQAVQHLLVLCTTTEVRERGQREGREEHGRRVWSGCGG